MPLTVSIVDDNPLLRKSLSSLLNSTDALECIGLYESVEDAEHGVASNPCDVLLMDIGLPGADGIEGTRRIKRAHPGIDIIMLTVYSDAGKIVEAICAGASGYLLKKTPPQMIIETITEIRSGGPPMSAAVARTVMDTIRGWRPKPPSVDAGDIPERETQVLQGIAAGKTYQQIADSLFISVDTVRTYVRHVYERLHVHSKVAALAEAKKRGFLA